MTPSQQWAKKKDKLALLNHFPSSPWDVVDSQSWPWLGPRLLCPQQSRFFKFVQSDTATLYILPTTDQKTETANQSQRNSYAYYAIMHYIIRYPYILSISKRQFLISGESRCRVNSLLAFRASGFVSCWVRSQLDQKRGFFGTFLRNPADWVPRFIRCKADYASNKM